VSVATLERWRAAARAAMDEAQRRAWCRQNGVYPSELQQWKDSATAALSDEPEERSTPQQRREAKKRIKEVERDLGRKDKALAETTALLVLSKMYDPPRVCKDLLGGSGSSVCQNVSGLLLEAANFLALIEIRARQA
jgi:hypothetical protein